MRYSFILPQLPVFFGFINLPNNVEYYYYLDSSVIYSIGQAMNFFWQKGHLVVNSVHFGRQNGSDAGTRSIVDQFNGPYFLSEMMKKKYLIFMKHWSIEP